MIYKSFGDLVGKTPIVRISNFEKNNNLIGNVFAKLEYLNPAGSVKDRIAKRIVEDAEERGILKKNAVIIEPTSGNTGIGLAAVCASKGYRLILTMPETMSVERRNLVKAYGAEVVLTDGAKGMSGAIEKADELAKEIDGALIAGQFTNPVNPKTHFETTGPEIWEDMCGKIDIFVAGIGTGGTISGIGNFLKSEKSDVKIVGVEPYGSAVLSGGSAGVHKLQGIGAGFVPETYDVGVCDEIFAIKDEEAFEFGRKFVKSEGFLIGISSGAALAAAVKLAKKEENRGKNIVVLLPDSGDRYLSTELFSEK